MPQNTNYESLASTTEPVAYKKRLHTWAIARLGSDTERVIVARFRTRSDADGYLRHLRQVMPSFNFEVIVDYQREQSVV
jgi:hypothetical protein